MIAVAIAIAAVEGGGRSCRLAMVNAEYPECYRRPMCVCPVGTISAGLLLCKVLGAKHLNFTSDANINLQRQHHCENCILHVDGNFLRCRRADPVDIFTTGVPFIALASESKVAEPYPLESHSL